MRLGFFFRHCATRGVLIYAASAIFCVATIHLTIDDVHLYALGAQNTTLEV